jgi:hypothetical protein
VELQPHFTRLPDHGATPHTPTSRVCLPFSAVSTSSSFRFYNKLRLCVILQVIPP